MSTDGRASPRTARRSGTTELDFEPVLLRRPGAGRPWEPALLRRWRPPTLVLLVVFLCLQFLIPARLVIGGLGSVGRPSVAVGILLAFLWVVSARRPGRLPAGRQPVRWLLGGYLAVQLVGYAVGYDRLLPQIEASSADRWLIYNVAMVGVALAVTDGLVTRRHLDILLRSVVALAAVMAFVGTLQFLRIVDLTRYIRIPGLRANRELIGVGARGDGDFARVAGTANHYIEFGVVLALVLPIALHYAFFAPPGRRWVRWLSVALIASAIPLSISRSAILTVAVSMGCLAVVWPWRRRYNVFAVGLVGLVVFHFVNRGVLGTIRSLFTNMDNDPSVQNRIADQAFVQQMFAQRPWLGRGPGTLLPERYILLDNQIYGTLVGGGILGLVALVALFAVPYAMARSVRLRAAGEESRHLGQALAAAFPAGLLASATFDSFGFATFAGTTMVFVGAAGALWRLEDVRPWRPISNQQGEFVTMPLTAEVRSRARAGWQKSRIGRPVLSEENR
ncbi:O-antigen ligase family protein [Georgenia wutianyii]|uniref:O-antigen ligase family protein n=1 Tax=Georgenia wutianyii TaxID=2585135 RepID=A0ABX5VP53_9MICO|nr:O-antigen ligase family protein [Georgenia wutianyii]QDB80222.1 O-antigen ligase family protein [Georgenia wutianyii]